MALGRRFGFKRRHLVQAAQVPILLRESGVEKYIHDLSDDGGSHRSSAEAQDIEVIVFNSLPRREMVWDEAGTDARDLVCAHASADSAAAYGDAALRCARSHRAGERNDKIRIIILRVLGMCAEIPHVMPFGTKWPMSSCLRQKPP